MAQTTTLPSLDFRPLSDHEWRVLDPACGENDPRRLVGFIDQDAAGVHVIRVRENLGRVDVRTVGEAVRLFQQPPA